MFTVDVKQKCNNNNKIRLRIYLSIYLPLRLNPRGGASQGREKSWPDQHPRGWSGGAMVLGKLLVPGHPTIWLIVGQGPIAPAVMRVGVVWTFILSSILSPLSPSLWETVRYRLKYCLEGPLNQKQPTNQHPNPGPPTHPARRTRNVTAKAKMSRALGPQTAWSLYI